MAQRAHPNTLYQSSELKYVTPTVYSHEKCVTLGREGHKEGETRMESVKKDKLLD